MQQQIQTGTVLLEESPSVCAGERLLLRQLECAQASEGVPFDQKVHAAGWHFSFIGAEVKVTFLGELEDNKIRKLLHTNLRKLRGRSFNCIKVTGIIAKSFLGVSYTTVSAHSRYLQQRAELAESGGWEAGTNKLA